MVLVCVLFLFLVMVVFVVVFSFLGGGQILFYAIDDSSLIGNHDSFGLCVFALMIL